jgi:hypothetical protein
MKTRHLLILCFCFFTSYLGCKPSKPVPDPLAGWQKAYKEEPDQAIKEDCQNYIEKLSPEERKSIAYIEYYKDETGQHAEKVTIGLNRKNWRHVLVYDKDDKRIKTIKYISGDSHS